MNTVYPEVWVPLNEAGSLFKEVPKQSCFILMADYDALAALLRRVRRAGIKCSETRGQQWEAAVTELFELIHGDEISAVLAADSALGCTCKSISERDPSCLFHSATDSADDALPTCRCGKGCTPGCGCDTP